MASWRGLISFNIYFYVLWTDRKEKSEAASSVLLSFKTRSVRERTTRPRLQHKKVGRDCQTGVWRHEDE